MSRREEEDGRRERRPLVMVWAWTCLTCFMVLHSLILPTRNADCLHITIFSSLHFTSLVYLFLFGAMR